MSAVEVSPTLEGRRREAANAMPMLAALKHLR
jgi:hypothetical protein